MKFYHLSHTDLDGYTCQFITKHLFEDGYFVNANYGDEVTVRIDEILGQIEKRGDESYFLITDLNLSLQEAQYLDSRVKELENVKLQLLDHHLSGLDTSMKFDWYHLDSTKSASLITFNFFKDEKIEHLEKLINAVNAVDIWLSEDRLFEFGKVLMRGVDEAKEINRVTFLNEGIAYKHHILKRSLDFLKNGADHIAFDDELWKIKKSFFIQERNDTLDNLITGYILKLLKIKKELMTIYFRDYKGILTFGIQNSSIIGNAFLKAHPDYHFFMNVNSRGTFSLRADNKMDVSQMAEAVAGGGGHPNASGGKIKDFKEFFIYEELKSFIEELLKEKE